MKRYNKWILLFFIINSSIYTYSQQNYDNIQKLSIIEQGKVSLTNLKKNKTKLLDQKWSGNNRIKVLEIKSFLTKRQSSIFRKKSGIIRYYSNNECKKSQLVIESNMSYVRIDTLFQIITTTGINYIIPENSLDFTLKELNTDFHPFLGGEIYLVPDADKLYKFWITNSKKVELTEKGETKGEFKFLNLAYLKLSNLKLLSINNIDGLSSNLLEFNSSVNYSDSLHMYIDLSNERLRFSKNKLCINDRIIFKSKESKDMNIGGMIINVDSMIVNNICLELLDSTIRFNFNDIIIYGNNFSHNNKPILKGSLSEPISIKLLTGVSPILQEGISFSKTSINNLNLSAKLEYFKDMEGVSLINGHINLDIDTLSLNYYKGTFNISEMNSFFAFDKYSGSGTITAMNLNLEGFKNNLQGKGKIKFSNINLELTDELNVKKAFNKVDNNIVYTINGTINNVEGSLKYFNNSLCYYLSIPKINGSCKIHEYRGYWEERVNILAPITRWVFEEVWIDKVIGGFFGKGFAKVLRGAWKPIRETVKIELDIPMVISLSESNFDVNIRNLCLSNYNNNNAIGGGKIYKEVETFRSYFGPTLPLGKDVQKAYEELVKDINPAGVLLNITDFFFTFLNNATIFNKEIGKFNCSTLKSEFYED